MVDIVKEFIVMFILIFGFGVSLIVANSIAELIFFFRGKLKIRKKNRAALLRLSRRVPSPDTPVGRGGKTYF